MCLLEKRLVFLRRHGAGLVVLVRCGHLVSVLVRAVFGLVRLRNVVR